MNVIYEPKGRAREYGELACNLFTGCDHGCRYCYCPKILHKTREKFQRVEMKKDVLTRLATDAGVMETLDDHRPVFLCFACDPYPKAEWDLRVTRAAIKILHRYEIPVRILTKGGMRAARDLGLLSDKDEFGVTLTFSDFETGQRWEPNAAPTRERIESLHIAKKRGIPTWVSLEPVIDMNETLRVIHRSYRVTDRYAVGTLNHQQDLSLDDRCRVMRTDWPKFVEHVERTLTQLGKPYYLKADLRRWKAR